MAPATPFDQPVIPRGTKPPLSLRQVTDDTPTASLAASLQEAEARFRILMDSARDGMLVFGADGCRYANRAFCRMFAYEEQRLLGLGIAEIFATDPAAARTLHKRLRAVLLRGESPRLTLGITNPSSRRMDVAVRMQPLPDASCRLVHVSFRDITTTRRAYEMTVNTLSELTQVLDTAQEGLCIILPGRQIRHANHTLAEWLGRPLEKILHLSCDRVLGCGRCDTDACPVEAILQGAPSVEKETTLSADGHAPRPCRLYAVPYRSPSGRILGIIASYRDISDRKRVERRERLFRSLFEESSHILALLDRTGRIRELNRTAMVAFGADAERSLGLPVWESSLTGGDRAAIRRLRAGIVETRRGRTARFELSVPRSGAPGAWLDVSVRPVSDRRDAAGGLLILEARDISDRKRLEKGLHRERRKLEETVEERTRRLTEANDRLILEIRQRKHAEEATRRREEHLRQFYDIDLVGFFVIGAEYRLVDCSDGFAAMLGWTRETLRGRLWFDLLSPESASRARGRVEALSRHEVSGYEDERQFRRADGSLLVGSIAIRPLYDAAGRLLQVVGLVLDITDRKIQERALRQAKAALERSNAELASFIYAVSHDLQAPLRKVVAFGERLRSTEEGSVSEAGAENLKRMIAAAARMQEQIRALLSLSRVTGKELPFETVDVNAVLSEVLSTLEVSIEETGARIESDELPVIEANREQLCHLLQNLVGNALKFHKPGSVPRIGISSVRLTPEAAEAEGLPPEPAVAILVRDNGIGIHPRDQGRIFEIFQRLHEPGAYPGTGVGLALCWKIARAHRGCIAVDSVPDEGSTFRVLLPLRGVRANREE